MAELLSKSASAVIESLTAATANVTLTPSTTTFYVDEAVGSDTASTPGTLELPYKSVAGAYTSQGQDDLVLLVRQAVKEGETEGAFEPVSASAIKKGKKLYAQFVQKQRKAEELRLREESEGKEKREKELKKLEDAKKIVLVQPGTEARKIKIRQSVASRGERVRIFGWVHRLRQQGGMTFVVLRDGTGYLQCVLSGDLVSV